MPQVGHSTTVKVSGVAVPIVAEATTNLGSNVFQITASARRIVSPAAAVQVYDGGVLQAATLYTFNYLFGKVTFLAPPGGAVTITCSYLPVASLASVRALKFAAAADLLDSTNFDSAGAKAKTTALIDCSGDLEMLSTPMEDIDPVTGGVQTLHSVLTTGTAKLLECVFGSYYLRAWIMLESIEVTAAVADLVVSTANYQGAPQAAGAVFEISLP